MTTTGIAITGSGAATPSVLLDNHQLSQLVETSDEWISSRTGIRQRGLATTEVRLSQMAASACQNAIAMAGVQPTDIDLIILATSTADDLFGSASQIQAQIGATKAVAFDLTAACSGFVFGLVTASQFIRNGVYKNVLLVGRIFSQDGLIGRTAALVFYLEMGAGAVVLQASDRDNLLGFELKSDGSLNSSLNLACQPEPKALTPEITIGQGKYLPITMNGQDIYRFAVKKVPEVVEKALFHSGLTAADVDWLILHQANQRILDAVAQRLKIPPHKVISNLANYGNTSAASIPLALDEVVRSGKIQSGDIIATAGFGAGLTWGSAIFKWGN
ncbi:beta-ketoacyl-ACP synthase III [Limnospira platensis]|uniref:beta-ketoacyl-ACP synthase III n=1 Tax=Limnospira platensis TaxID=118562 RepID=UPI0021AA5D91|nr:3-oxoacyl-[acyl-carrier-protein] synthase-3 [Arthrospira platensis C1]